MLERERLENREDDQFPVEKGGLYKNLNIQERTLNIVIITMAILFIVWIIYILIKG